MAQYYDEAPYNEYEELDRIAQDRYEQFRRRVQKFEIWKRECDEAIRERHIPKFERKRIENEYNSWIGCKMREFGLKRQDVLSWCGTQEEERLGRFKLPSVEQ